MSSKEKKRKKRNKRGGKKNTKKLRSPLSKTGQPSWDSLTTSQQISIILGNPPLSLPTKLHKAWTETTLHKIIPYISSLEALLYT